MRACILLTIFGLCWQSLQASKPGKPRGLLYEWHTRITYPRDNIRVVESGDLILEVSEVEDYTSKIKSILIQSTYPGHEELSCKIPDLSLWGAAGIGNRKVVVLARVQWVQTEYVKIVNVTDCSVITIETNNNNIIPLKDAFIIINRHEPCAEGHMCMKHYDHNGNLLEEHDNIPLNGDSDDRRKFDSIMDPSGFLKHFILRYPCSYECYRSYIEILNPANHSVDSRRIEYYPLAHSAAHGNFSICFRKSGLQCKLFNHDFQPYHENATEFDNSDDWTITFVSMHNLLGGGVLVVHCSTHYLTECSLRYDVIDADGKKHRGDVLDREYRTGGGSPRNPHSDPQNRPTIFEKDAENRIYCIAMVYSTVKCIKIENF